VKAHLSRTILSLVVVAPCLMVGCNTADNPKMPEMPPAQIKADTEVPKTGEGKEAYGASKKYQDSMPK